MNVTLQRHCARYIYVVPEGMKELMSDISREVLRMQPQNMYLFIADYLEALLLTRENARVAARLVQSITEIAEATIEFLEKTGMERPRVDRVVSIIHETFRKRIREEAVIIPHEEFADEIEEANIITSIITEANIEGDLGEEAARIIQNAYKKFKQRKDAERQLLSGMIDWRIAARSAIKLYRQTGVTNEEANRAATLIKAAYKGYYTRRVMRQLTEEQKLLHPEFEKKELTELEEVDIDYKHISRVDSKNVKIAYETVIPHVDFGDVTDLESPAAVIGFALDKVVDNVMIKVGHPEECKFPTKRLVPTKKPAKRSAKSKPGVKKPPSKKSERTSAQSTGKSAAGEPASKKDSKAVGKKVLIPQVGGEEEEETLSVDEGSFHSVTGSVKSGGSYASGAPKSNISAKASQSSGNKSIGSPSSKQSEASSFVYDEDHDEEEN